VMATAGAAHSRGRPVRNDDCRGYVLANVARQPVPTLMGTRCLTDREFRRGE
jgi:hypothetical protein